MFSFISNLSRIILIFQNTSKCKTHFVKSDEKHTIYSSKITIPQPREYQKTIVKYLPGRLCYVNQMGKKIIIILTQFIMGGVRRSYLSVLYPQSFTNVIVYRQNFRNLSVSPLVQSGETLILLLLR